jgi:sphinganine-1-phosphate aldolase
MSYLKHQFFVSTDWPGGIYASPSMGGTRPGGCISAAWAALMGMGASGYMTRAEGAMKVARRMREGIAAIDGISICGNPHMTIATFQGSEGVDIFVVADLLEKKGWTVDRQQYPSSIHCTCNANQTEAVEEYLLDLAATVETARAHPELSSEGDAPMYGMMAKVPFRGLVRHSVMKVMEGMYAPDGADPDLSSLGSGDDDGFILKAINKYGDRAMAALDKLEALRNTFRKG